MGTTDTTPAAYIGRHRGADEQSATWLSPNDVEHLVPLGLDGSPRPCATCGQAHEIAKARI